MPMRLAPLALALALALGGGGVAWTGISVAQESRSPLERLPGERLFTVAYTQIADVYLDPPDLRRLMVDGLRGLSEVEPDLTLGLGKDKILAKVGNLSLGEMALPDGNDPQDWAQASAKLLEKLRAISPKLGALGRDELYSHFFTAMVADLDPYSRYTDARQAGTERSQREGYGGVGISIRYVEGVPEIAAMQAEGPAEKAGLVIGERIYAIDGTATAGLEQEAIGNRLRGMEGTSVTLTVGPVANRTRKVSVRRAHVVPTTVEARVTDGVGVLRVDRFNAATETTLRAAAARLAQQLGSSAKGYVLDLRGNPGGKLDQAVAVADLFVREGRIITTRGRNPASLQQWDAKPDDILDGKPLVVLVDGRSASAAEIVAASLQDSGRAVLVGASSYGKGSVQTVTTLPNQGELFLTWARIYAPSGYTLHRQGVQPTICTSNDVATPDQAFQVLKSGGEVPPSTLALWRMRAPEDEAALNQLRGACPYKEHAPELDVDIAKALLADPNLYARALAVSGTRLAQR